MSLPLIMVHNVGYIHEHIYGFGKLKNVVGRSHAESQKQHLVFCSCITLQRDDMPVQMEAFRSLFIYHA